MGAQTQTFGDCLVDRLYEAKAKAGKDKTYRLDRYELVRIVNDELAKLNAADASPAAPPVGQNCTQTAKLPTGLVEYTTEAFEALRVRICGWAQFKRKRTTNWSEKELKALKKIFPYDLDDLAIIERWYNGADPQRQYCRKDIITLLNNWPGEGDRARTHVGEAKTQAPRDYSKI